MRTFEGIEFMIHKIKEQSAHSLVLWVILMEGGHLLCILLVAW